jgi:hypothetical protein
MPIVVCRESGSSRFNVATASSALSSAASVTRDASGQRADGHAVA